MIRLYDTGAYLLNGTELIEDNADAAARLHQALGAQVPSKEEAAKNTIAYSILRDHNTSGNMEKLKVKFDKLTSHDITFVGIIQTARACMSSTIRSCSASRTAIPSSGKTGTRSRSSASWAARICRSSS